MKIKISNGRVIDPASDIDQIADIAIADGKIISVGKMPDHFSVEYTIDASNAIVVPGVIDLCARMREPGLEHKATILSESKAAVAGGVTTVCCPPDTNPIIDTPSVAELIHQRTQTARRCRIYPIAAATHGLAGTTLSEMQALKDIGCIAVANAYEPIENNEILRRVMEYAYSCDLSLMLFCEDPSLKNTGTAHEGAVSMALGLPGIPETAETTAISNAILLTEKSKCRLHICRLSTARGVEMVKDAKSRGLPITADVSIQHLYLTEHSLSNFDSQFHLRPPLRTTQDKHALLQGIANGDIDCVCSDHQPHDDDAKSAPFSLTEPGASSIEHFLPLAVNLAEQDSMDLQAIIRTITLNPATVLGIEAGALSVNRPADICIFNPNNKTVIHPNNMVSAGKNTPFAGMELSGRVQTTLVDGNIVFES